VIDLIGSDAKFRYAAEQRNFFDLTAELNGRTAELQRNSWERIFVAIDDLGGRTLLE
jgi:hypothetical protein